jgi:cysteine sulfinate desulfinase/cysteine desulfurase-like protein
MTRSTRIYVVLPNYLPVLRGTEHGPALETARHLERVGVRVAILPVGGLAVVSSDALFTTLTLS